MGYLNDAEHAEVSAAVAAAEAKSAGEIVTVLAEQSDGYSDIQLTPEAGLMVLFPCWMEHYVEPHDSDEPRIVIAFNAVLPQA